MFSVGGICGTSRGNIEYSINYGDITAENGYFRGLLVGGICGNLYSRYQTDKIKINSCINHGNLSFNNISFVTRANSFSHFGGIAGMTHYFHSINNGFFKETIQYVSNCYNTGNFIEKGTVTNGYKDFGGIVGHTFFPYSTYSCKISSCYNIGEMKINFIPDDMTLDPVICMVYEFNELSLPIPVENCFYNSTPAWKQIRNYRPVYYFSFEHGNVVKSQLDAYAEIANNEIYKSSVEFYRDSWPTSAIWDDKVWRDFGSWNNGNPVYPKLKFEKD
jgi:hypothetical protein